MNTITVNELQAGQVFRKPGQRKWRIASDIWSLPPSVTISGVAGFCVSLADCSQVELSPDDIIEIPNPTSDLETDGFIKLRHRR